MRHSGEHDHDSKVGVGAGDRGVDHSDPDAPLDDTPPTDAFKDAMSQFAELKDYATQYVAARIGSIKAGVRSAIAWTVLGVLALIAGISMIVTAGALLVIGLAQGVATLLGGRAWAGNLIIGFVLLAAIMLAGWVAIHRFLGGSRQQTLASYERRLQQQRAHHGHDARQRSTEQRYQQHARRTEERESQQAV